MPTPLPAPATPTDQSLALRAQQGSSADFGTLVERHQGRVFSFLLRRCRSRQDAEDLAQETFVRAWRKIGTYRPGSGAAFSTWLLTIAARLVATHHRRGLLSEPGPALPELADGRHQAPSRSLERDEERRGVWAVVDRTLAPEPRAAVWLRYAEGLSVAEVAAVLGRTSLSTRVMLFRARERLLAELEPVRDPAPERRPGANRVLEEPCDAASAV